MLISNEQKKCMRYSRGCPYSFPVDANRQSQGGLIVPNVKRRLKSWPRWVDCDSAIWICWGELEVNLKLVQMLLNVWMMESWILLNHCLDLYLMVSLGALGTFLLAFTFRPYHDSFLFDVSNMDCCMERKWAILNSEQRRSGWRRTGITAADWFNEKTQDFQSQDSYV